MMAAFQELKDAIRMKRVNDGLLEYLFITTLANILFQEKSYSVAGYG